MALRIIPGPIPKDGEKFLDVEEQLKAFVNRTEILNIGVENFEGNVTPFVVSQTEMPTFRTPGQLWFKRGEGRMYAWFAAGASAESSISRFNETGDTWVSGNMPMQSGHWIAVSDRKEMYALCASDGLYRHTLPYQPVRLTGGMIADSAGSFATDWDFYDTHKAPYDTGAGNGLWENVGSGNSSTALVCPRVDSWAGRIYSSKLFVNATAVTVVSPLTRGIVVHDVGYKRVASTGTTGPIYASVESSFDAPGDAAHARRNIHWPPSGATSPYYCNHTTQAAFVGYITESGPAKETPERLLTFWFASCPTNNFDPE